MVHHRQLTRDDRLRLETLYNAGHSKKDIAARLHVHISTVYRELKRGRYDKRHWELYMVSGYSADIAQKDRDFKVSSRGAPLKIGSDFALASYIERLIAEEGYSPAAVAARLRDHPCYNSLCEVTIYRYVHDGVLDVTPEQLPEHGKRKHPYKKVTKQNKTKLGTSIEMRPKHINGRAEFGHWEGDCVQGKQGTSGTFLVFTERKTRAELIFKMRHQRAEDVISVLDTLQEHCAFRKLFKTITFDNGSEFSDSARIEHSRAGRRRTDAYYCHPCSPGERGSNEVANRFIRRRYPKGVPLTRVTQQECRRTAAWMNQYPREVLGWKSASELFLQECAAAGITITPYLSQYLY